MALHNKFEPLHSTYMVEAIGEHPEVHTLTTSYESGKVTWFYPKRRTKVHQNVSDPTPTTCSRSTRYVNVDKVIQKDATARPLSFEGSMATMMVDASERTSGGGSI